MLKNKIFIVAANPKSRGGVASVIKSTMNAGMYSKESRYFFPNSEGNFLNKCFVFMSIIVKYFFYILLDKPEFVHLHTSSYLSFYRKSLFIIIARFFKIEYCIHIHGGSFVLFYNKSGLVRKNYIKFCLDGARFIIAVSEESKIELGSTFTESYIKFIPNFIFPIPLSEPSVFNNIVNPFTLLYLADISDAKGFSDAVKITSSLRNEFPSVHLKCAGKFNSEYFNKVIKENDAIEYVDYVGFLTGNDKYRFLMCGSILVSPSKVEAFGMSNLESVLVGTPVFGYSVGGVPTVIKNFVNGVLVDQGDWQSLVSAIRPYLKKHQLLVDLKRSSVGDAKKRFSIKNIELLYKSLY
jgi:glycosyltransferase involved in cell wall biosynthesis